MFILGDELFSSHYKDRDLEILESPTLSNVSSYDEPSGNFRFSVYEDSETKKVFYGVFERSSYTCVSYLITKPLTSKEYPEILDSYGSGNILDSIYVAPRFQELGWAKELIRTAIRDNSDSVLCTSPYSNTRAFRLYKSIAIERYGDTEVFVSMRGMEPSLLPLDNDSPVIVLSGSCPVIGTTSIADDRCRKFCYVFHPSSND